MMEQGGGNHGLSAPGIPFDQNGSGPLRIALLLGIAGQKGISDALQRLLLLFCQTGEEGSTYIRRNSEWRKISSGGPVPSPQA